jgi:hypothetical protein
MRDVTVDVDGDKILEPFMGTMPGLCQPSDMAEAVLFLATANAVNGAELAVDKGWSTSWNISLQWMTGVDAWRIEMAGNAGNPGRGEVGGKFGKWCWYYWKAPSIFISEAGKLEMKGHPTICIRWPKLVHNSAR